MRSLVVVTHPNPEGLARQALVRVVTGLERAGDEVRIIDLDAEGFDPRLTVDEKRRHLDPPESKPWIADHAEALHWAERLVLVYPTWFGGFPARLEGWFDRTWITGVAYSLPEGATRIHAGLTNIRRLEIVTTHADSRWSNVLGGRPGRLIVFRTLRLLCHPLCRRRFHPIYSVETASDDEIETWLEHARRAIRLIRPAGVVWLRASPSSERPRDRSFRCTRSCVPAPLRHHRRGPRARRSSRIP